MRAATDLCELRPAHSSRATGVPGMFAGAENRNTGREHLDRARHGHGIRFNPDRHVSNGGSFDVGWDNEMPVQEVRVESFYLAKYPVTQGQWEKADAGETLPSLKEGTCIRSSRSAGHMCRRSFAG